MAKPGNGLKQQSLEGNAKVSPGKESNARAVSTYSITSVRNLHTTAGGGRCFSYQEE